jgi:hypothetical protein
MMVTTISSTFITYKTDMKSALGYNQIVIKLVRVFTDFDLLSGIINNFTLPWMVLLLAEIVKKFYEPYSMASFDQENRLAQSLANVL